MKKIIILRHSNAEIDFETNDYDRRLTTTGILKAKQVSEKLKTSGIIPELIISSSATRTLQTSKIFAETLGLNKELILPELLLYNDYTTSEFIDHVRSVSGNSDTVLVCGHNPTISKITHQLSDFPNHCMMPCSVVVLEFEVDSWEKLEARSGKVYATI